VTTPEQPPNSLTKKPWFWAVVVALGLVLVCCLGVATRAVLSSDDGGDSQSNASDPPQTDAADPVDDETNSRPAEVGEAPAETSQAPAEIEMPSVVDENAAVAKDELESLGFTNVQFGSVDDENDTLGVVNPANWTVVEQSHQAGDKVRADAVIVLGCKKN
jgi:hypothetical protein